MILLTNRLILRPININDAGEIFEYRSDAEVNKYQSWIPETPDDAKEFISRTSAEINAPGTWFQFVLILKETGKIIGDAGIHFPGIDTTNQVEIGLTLSKDFQKKGLAFEATTRIIDFIFNDLNKNRIIASVDPENQDSIKLLEKLGFRKKAHFIKSLFINGKWVDDVIYSLFRGK